MYSKISSVISYVCCHCCSEVLTGQEKVVFGARANIAIPSNLVNFFYISVENSRQYKLFGFIFNFRLDDFNPYISLPTFLLLFLLCVQSSKSCREGSILPEHSPLNLRLVVFTPLVAGHMCFKSTVA